MTVSALLLLLSLIIFVFAAFDKGRWSVNLTALGLAFLAAALLVIQI